MKKKKQLILRGIFVLEICIFLGTYFFGAQGIKALTQLNGQHKQLVHEIAQLEDDITTLEQKISTWQTDSFYKEKIARERLHMARKNELIYYVS